MSLLGKFMAVLNVVMAAVFVYLAVLDKNARDKWSHAALRHELALDGLPVDDAETDRHGQVKVERVSDGTLKQVFKTGAPVKTQVEESRKLQDALQAKAANPGEKSTATQVLARILLPLAQTTDRREGLIKLRDGKDLTQAELEATFDGEFATQTEKLKGPEKQQAVTDRLQADFKKAFDEISRTASPGSAKRDLAEKRQALARLFIQLTEVLKEDEAPPPDAKDAPRTALDSQAYRRALAVMGLEAAVKEVNLEAATLQKLTRDMDYAMARDRTAFVEQHRRWVEFLAAIAQEVDKQKHTLEIEKNKVTQLEEEVKTRQKDFKETGDKLDKVQDNVKQKLREQAKKEQEIIAKQNELHNSRTKIHELERQIRELELAAQKGKTP